MNTPFRAALLTVALLVSGTAFAAQRVATLEVENMSCVACAPIVKRALSRVSGVSHVAVLERAGLATVSVTFDDAKTTPAALSKATADAGFRSTVKDVKSALNTTPSAAVALR